MLYSSQGFEGSLRGNAPLVVRNNQSLYGGRVLPVWGPEYEVKFDLKINSWSDNWGLIFRFSAAFSENFDEIGQRIPAMWTKAGSQDQLALATNINSNGNRWFENELGSFENGSWYRFVISQKNESVGIF